MKRKVASFVLVAVICFSLFPTLLMGTGARAAGNPKVDAELTMSQYRYQPTETVTFTYINKGFVNITLGSTAPWVIKNSAGNMIYAPIALCVIVDVLPGEGMTWTWDQTDDTGKQSPPGNYTVELKTLNAGTYTTNFQISTAVGGEVHRETMLAILVPWLGLAGLALLIISAGLLIRWRLTR